MPVKIVKGPPRTKGAMIHFGPPEYMAHMREWWERTKAEKAEKAQDLPQRPEE